MPIKPYIYQSENECVNLPGLPTGAKLKTNNVYLRAAVRLDDLVATVLVVEAVPG